MSICFYDKTICNEMKNILVENILENGQTKSSLCCLYCLTNKLPQQLMLSKSTINKKCPNCDINLLEIIQQSKIGCPLCYSFFYDEIKILIKNCQNFKDENFSKIPLGIHHKSALVACVLKDLEKIKDKEEIISELKEYLKNY